MTIEYKPESGLRRRITLPLLIFYGIGTILGAGIYVLVGKVAGAAGMLTPIAFLVAAVLAGLTAFSYAELSARYPKSAGEAVYIHASFNSPALATAVGFLIVAVGVTSTATLINGLLGYLAEFITVQRELTIVIVITLLSIIVTWGIAQSVVIASIMTLVEILGLLIILWVARDSWGAVPARLPELLAITDLTVLSGILLGAFIAFYAFIGFEDMVNVAEEVKNPEKTLPRGIIIALIVTTGFYVIVAIVSVLSVDPKILDQSDAPLALIYQTKTGSEPTFIVLISLISILNGALIQMVMASRILYGMSRNKWLPAFLSVVNPKTRTPINATLVITAMITLFALLLPLLSLAKITSFITLMIFALINLALWRIKRRHPDTPAINIPLWVPVIGFLFCASFLLYQLIEILTPS